VLNQILDVLQNKRTNADERQQKLEPLSTATADMTDLILKEDTGFGEFLDRSFDENDFMLFLDEIETLVVVICDIWAAATEEKKLFSASIGKLCFISMT
jgi:hypothetical protein